jgi:hypothetical protein
MVASHGGTATRQSLRDWCNIYDLCDIDVCKFDRGACDASSKVLSCIYETCQALGLSFVLGNLFVRNEYDSSKGGWSNLMSFSDQASSMDDLYLYISSVKSITKELRAADEAGDHLKAARLLGIPECCAKFFSAVWPVASNSNGDPSTFSCALTAEKQFPWKWETNITAQYFGMAPISFFPCSFMCPKAAHIGRASAQIMNRFDPAAFNSIRRKARGCFLFTESHGVHRWPHYSLRDGKVLLGADHIGTLHHEEYVSLEKIEFESPHNLRVYNSSDSFVLEGADVALCLF